MLAMTRRAGERQALPEWRWYAVMTGPRAEAQAYENLRRQNYWAFYPHTRTKEYVGQHRQRRRLMEIERPLMPRYIFVALRFVSDSVGVVNDTIGVARVVCKRFSGEPLRIPNPVMDEIIERADDDGLVPTVKKSHWFKASIGDKLRLTEDQPYFGLIAELSSIADLDRHGQIKVWLDFLGGRREVEIPATAVAEVRQAS